MKGTATSLTLFLLSVCIGACGFIGCGEKREGADEDTFSSETGSPAAVGGAVAEFKANVISISNEMNELVQGIRSVEDVEKAEPQYEAIIDRMIARFSTMTQHMTRQDYHDMEKLMDDPEFRAAMQRKDEVIRTLHADHPEAAAKLEELSKRHKEKLNQAMMAMVEAMMRKMNDNPGTMEDGADTTR